MVKALGLEIHPSELQPSSPIRKVLYNSGSAFMALLVPQEMQNIFMAIWAKPTLTPALSEKLENLYRIREEAVTAWFTTPPKSPWFQKSSLLRKGRQLFIPSVQGAQETGLVGKKDLFIWYNGTEGG